MDLMILIKTRSKDTNTVSEFYEESFCPSQKMAVDRSMRMSSPSQMPEGGMRVRTNSARAGRAMSHYQIRSRSLTIHCSRA